jgi:hypothetical protein
MLHKVLNVKAEKQEKEIKIPSKNPNKEIIQKDAITLMKTLPKNKGYVLKLHPQEIEITRKLKDIYWLHGQLMLEFPYYYVL